ncbi:MAG: HypC/HybG/HupF family hydrogenase formation chaperone [archaeon]|nr:HypC/HybG/HupF family hydrogenase formation chaperone [archaeon]MCP8314310.1 HypC/HybG/HupF family hydrogenase formation chaperone [archaeon]MCP8318182.1 HypC/HybG/HupF family hydrogenase formation chaperone [archaeon]MCP8319675.1 HypC/HybG/HupF family hydrogenase formation chaperone [archaeon]
MCLGVPGKLVKIVGTKGIVSFGGAKREVDLSLIEKPIIGEYVIVHAGFAIEKIDEAEAKETIRLLREAFYSL